MKPAQHIYSLEPQRRISMGDAGWTICKPSEAERFAIIQLTIAKSGKRRFRTRRVLETTDSWAKAQQTLAQLIQHRTPKRKKSK